MTNFRLVAHYSRLAYAGQWDTDSAVYHAAEMGYTLCHKRVGAPMAGWESFNGELAEKRKLTCKPCLAAFNKAERDA